MRYALNAILLFAVTATTVISMSVSGRELSPDARAALLWSIVFFSAMSGLHRTFVREVETRTIDALRLSAPPVAVFLGKWLFNLGLLLALEAIVTVLFLVFLESEILRWEIYLSALLLGGVGLVTVSTLMAAMIANTRAGGTLFAVLCFPALVPILKSAIALTGFSLGSQFPGGAIVIPALQLLFSFAGMMLTVSLMLFDFVWKSG